MLHRCYLAALLVVAGCKGGGREVPDAGPAPRDAELDPDAEPAPDAPEPTSDASSVPDAPPDAGNGCAGVGFPGPPWIPTANGPRSVIVADVDRDGLPDLVVGTDTTLSIELGLGGGQFRRKVEVPLAAGAGLAVADVNRDGKPDVIVAAGTVGVLLGNGDGTFQPEVDVVASFDAERVAAGDLDGDGAPDLVFYPAPNNGSTGHVSVVLGRGDGTFGAVASYPVPTAARDVAIAQLRNGGTPDLVVMGVFSMSVLPGRGDGTFTDSVALPALLPSTAMTVADINRDGALDVVTAQTVFDDFHRNLSVFYGNGDGTFQSRVDFDVGSTIIAIAIADLDGDGAPDFVVVLDSDPRILVLLGSAAGGPDGSVRRTVTGAFPRSPVVADISGDGRPDLVAVNTEVAQVSVSLGNGDGTFFDGPPPSLEDFFFMADLDGDSQLDAIGPALSGVQVQLAVGNGTFQPPASSAVFATPGLAVPADVNHDGKLDVITVPRDLAQGPVLSVLRGNGDGTFQASVNQVLDDPGFPGIVAMTAADLSGDGNADLVIAYATSTSNFLRVLIGNGNGTFGPGADYPTDGMALQVAAADLDGDGITDLVVLSGTETLSVLLGKPDGTFQPRVDSLLGAPPGMVVIADVNADGKLDLLIYVDSFALHAVRVLLGAGDGTFTFRGDYPVKSFARSIGMADVTGDTRADVVLYAPFAHIVSVLSGDGAGAFPQRKDYAASGTVPNIAVGDVTSDGNPDILVSGGSVFVTTCPP